MQREIGKHTFAPHARAEIISWATPVAGETAVRLVWWWTRRDSNLSPTLGRGERVMIGRSFCQAAARRFEVGSGLPALPDPGQIPLSTEEMSLWEI